MNHYSKTNFFTDGQRKIDFVLVHQKLISETQTSQINRYLDNLKRKGIHIEKENGISMKELIFVKLHAPDHLLLDLANVHHVILTFQKDNTLPKYKQYFKFMTNDVMRKPKTENEQHALFQRSTRTVGWQKEKNITSAERILLIYYLLTHTHFGFLKEEYGIRKMIKRKIFVDAYPLHDGDWKWSEDGLLNDRQILSKYWANARSWNKFQPIHIIQKYYGQEIAFYFVWTGFYIKMLLPVSVIGFLSFIYGVCTLGFVDSPRISGICDSELPMCPKCLMKQCRFKLLKEYCVLAKVSYVFDNWSTIIFAVMMSFWATCFIEIWKRKEFNYLFKWNLLSTAPEMDIMPEFSDQTHYTRISPHTGVMESYVPTRIKIFHYIISTICCLFVVAIVYCTVMVRIMVKLYVQYDIILRHTKFVRKQLTFTMLCFSSTLSVLVIKLYKPFITRMAMKLTHNENQRTQLEHYNSYTFKIYLLSCVNNYVPLLYVAMAKEKFFTHPGYIELYTEWFGIRADICPPSGCLVSLSVLISFVMIVKSFTGKILAFIIPVITRWIKRMKRIYVNRSYKVDNDDLPQWEIDYVLDPYSEYALIGDFTELVLQYGLVTFFVAAMPLAPLFALLNNVLEVRLDANKYLRHTRRPVPRRMLGLGAWNGIIRAKNYLSTLCNALVITFTSQLIPRELYRLHNGHLRGFINSTLSQFHVDDYEPEIRNRLNKNYKNISVCFYKGARNSFRDPEKYALNQEFFKELAMRFCMVVVFEHIIFFLTQILANHIPNIPYWLKERLTYEDNIMKRQRQKEMREQYLKDLRMGVLK